MIEVRVAERCHRRLPTSHKTVIPKFSNQPPSACISCGTCGRLTRCAFVRIFPVSPQYESRPESDDSNQPRKGFRCMHFTFFRREEFQRVVLFSRRDSASHDPNRPLRENYDASNRCDHQYMKTTMDGSDLHIISSVDPNWRDAHSKQLPRRPRGLLKVRIAPVHKNL
ncbi:hypothetical protein ACLOJK_030693 [Asimina triloba]